MPVLPVLSAPRPAVVVALCEDDGTVAGEFGLRARLDQVLADRPARVVVDLGDCPRLDAPGLRVLADAADLARAQGTDLELTRCSPYVLRLLEAAGHASLLPLG